MEYFNLFIRITGEKFFFPIWLNHKLWNIAIPYIICHVEDMYSRIFNNAHVEEDSNIGYFIISKEIV